jgi:hypothetical protein
MELFARFSYTYPAGDKDIKNDSEINRILNDKLFAFIKANSIEEYHILNGQISSLPRPAFGPGNESVLCSLNISYRQPIETD